MTRRTPRVRTRDKLARGTGPQEKKPRGFKPGTANTKGRPVGSVNRVTRDVRRVIAEFAENCAPLLEQWIVRVSRKDPARAADLFLKAIEYHIPKVKDALPPGGELELAERLAGRLALPLSPGESSTLYLALLTAAPPPLLPVTVDGESTPTGEEHEPA